MVHFRGYFVPKDENLKFFAYYPYYDDVRYGTTPVKMYGSELTAYPAPSFTYTMPDNAEDQQDLMSKILVDFVVKWLADEQRLREYEEEIEPMMESLKTLTDKFEVD